MREEVRRVKYVCTLLAVKDIEQAKEFYHAILGQEVVEDLGANVTLTGGFALQTAESWAGFLHKQPTEIAYGGNDAELYFEEDDIDAFVTKLSRFNISYVHRLQEHAWGQRVIRFYDLDGHIIEVGEALTVVVQRFLREGLTAEQTAVRMGISRESVNALLPQT